MRFQNQSVLRWQTEGDSGNLTDFPDCGLNVFSDSIDTKEVWGKIHKAVALIIVQVFLQEARIMSTATQI